MELGTFVIPVIGFIILFGLVFGRLYRRATHEVSPVNMKTLRLEVRRTGEAALVTQDRMRVDVGVEFYVSVMPTDEGIARAAQTLGDRPASGPAE